MLESFLCDMCARNTNHYFKVNPPHQIYSLTEALSAEMAALDPENQGRIDRLLEAFENSMVNEDNRYSSAAPKKFFANQMEMMEHSTNKRVKNDFKDDVKYFLHLMIQPSVTLKQMDSDDRFNYLKGYFESINRFFHDRRLKEDHPTIKCMKLMHGFTMPFENYHESNLIVRIANEEFIVFETKERSPYMCVIETIE